MNNKKRVSEEPKQRQHVHISATCLPIGDWIPKSSDGYIKLIIDGQKRYQSEVIDTNLCPVWKKIRAYSSATRLKFRRNESYFAIENHDVLVTVEVWDRDPFYKKEDFSIHTN